MVDAVEDTVQDNNLMFYSDCQDGITLDNTSMMFTPNQSSSGCVLATGINKRRSARP